MPDKIFAFGSLNLNPRVAHNVDPDGPNDVIDGDTIKIGDERWRLYGWDAPPITGNCCDEERQRGAAAKAYLEQLMQWGASSGTLRILVRASTEKYHRRLITVMVNDQDVGALMREHGLADEYTGKGPKPKFCSCSARAELHDAEERMAEIRNAIRSAPRRPTETG